MGFRDVVIRGAAILCSLGLFVLTGEAALRVVYRDAGRQTLGGPGNQSFEHLTIGREQLRGRRDVGPRRAGVPRLMVLGDSITYGQGVRDWRDTWPEVVAASLEAQGRPHELAVFALPGRDIAGHIEELERWGARVSPDILIYQWYVNDVEVMSHRPDATRAWQRWAGHEWLRRRSFLYYFFNYKAAELLPPPARSYAEYIMQDFVPGTVEWSEFERAFHQFAVRAARLAPRRLMLLYPQVPYRGPYPLQALHDRMKALASAHVLAVPPVAWSRSAGVLEADVSAPWRQSLRIPAGSTGTVVETREYLVAPGRVSMEISVAPGAGSVTHDEQAVGAVSLVDAVSNETLATQAIVLRPDGKGFETVTMGLSVAGAGLRRVKCRVSSAGGRSWSLAAVGFPVDYGFEVVDLAEPLNRFNTHASIFDAHPNEAAHRVMAEHVLRAIATSARP